MKISRHMLDSLRFLAGRDEGCRGESPTSSWSALERRGLIEYTGEWAEVDGVYRADGGPVEQPVYRITEAGRVALGRAQ